MKHTINASFRNKSGKELSARHPIWSGDAIDAGHALKQFIGGGFLHAHVTPLVDTIVLHVIDAKGGRTTATEYAEDIIHGKGTSLGTSLLDEHADHGLSKDEVAAAQEALESRALAAMPQVASKAAANKCEPRYEHDIMVDLTGPHVPGVVGTVLDENPNLSQGMLDAIVGQVSRKAAARALEEILARHDETIYIDRKLGDGDVRNYGGCPPHGKTDQTKRNVFQLIYLGGSESALEHLRDEAERVRRATGCKITEAIVDRLTYNQMKRDLGMGPQADFLSVGGIKITVSDNPMAPPMSLVTEPRTVLVTSRHMGKNAVRKAMDRMREFNMDIQFNMQETELKQFPYYNNPRK